MIGGVSRVIVADNSAEMVRHARGVDAQVANAAGVGQNLRETDVVATIPAVSPISRLALCAG